MDWRDTPNRHVFATKCVSLSRAGCPHATATRRSAAARASGSGSSTGSRPIPSRGRRRSTGTPPSSNGAGWHPTGRRSTAAAASARWSSSSSTRSSPAPERRRSAAPGSECSAPRSSCTGPTSSVRSTCPHPRGRGDLGAGLLRARRRLGPGIVADTRRARRRRLRSQRAEDLDVRGPHGRRPLRPGADRSAGSQASRHLVPPHRGHHAPGITVRPLVDLAGRHYFNEVFFEDVRVPARNLVGEENAAGTWA